MKKLYEKNELLFAILWIVVYVVLFSLADSLSEAAGTPKLFTAVLSVAMAAVLLGFMGRMGLKSYYGLQRVRGSWKQYGWFLPLILLSTCNLWLGVTLQGSLPELAAAIIAMAGAGLVEELIFRGLLFKAMCRDDQRSAVIVGSVTFGVGHIVNLLRGEDVLFTLLQVLYAVAIGYLFIVIFLRSGSILPCIAAHCVINGMSPIGADGVQWARVAVCIALTVIPLLYAAWLQRRPSQEA